MISFNAIQGEGQQIVKLAAVNSRPRSSGSGKQTHPVLTITDLEQKLRKKVLHCLCNLCVSFPRDTVNTSR